ncbi:unnamed protein product [Moneuplotes crassus]|uniref:Uncharacterized protein n=1 Tax=Euplotes crassus TaxID=5936 RepID=A0AAD1Y1J2_EUPCR|nr:unnamed protein product [Moneuplotes crassus]
MILNTPAKEIFKNNKTNCTQNHTKDEIIQEEDLSSEGAAARRINSVCARAASTMISTNFKFNFNDPHLDDPNISIQSVRSVTFEQWCKKKEIMQRLKDKLIQDEKMKILEQKKMKNDFNETKQFNNWKCFKEWCKTKDRQARTKKKKQKKQKLEKKLFKLQKQENASRGFREWLKESLKESKRAQHTKKRKKPKKSTEEEEAQKKIQNSICYKEWKMKKIREERKEKREKKIKSQHDKEQLMFLKQQRRLINRAGDVMLAYSLNKSIRDLENIRRRPKSARNGLRR